MEMTIKLKEDELMKIVKDYLVKKQIPIDDVSFGFEYCDYNGEKAPYVKIQVADEACRKIIG